MYRPNPKLDHNIPPHISTTERVQLNSVILQPRRPFRAHPATDGCEPNDANRDDPIPTTLYLRPLDLNCCTLVAPSGARGFLSLVQQQLIVVFPLVYTYFIPLPHFFQQQSSCRRAVVQLTTANSQPCISNRSLSRASKGASHACLCCLHLHCASGKYQPIALGVARAWRVESRLNLVLTSDTPSPATRSKP